MKSALKKTLKHLICSPLFYLFLLLIEIRNVFKKTKIAQMRVDRIGHLAYNTEVFARQLHMGAFDKNTDYFLICGAPSNRQLLIMYQRVLKIYENKLLDKILLLYSKKFKNFRHFFDISENNNNNYIELNKACPILSLTNEEENMGKIELKKMGISNSDWFICFHARDSAYLAKTEANGPGGNNKFSYHDFRDSDISNYLNAAQFITEQGGYALRMGSAVAEPLTCNNPKIIDYATKYRSDFMDVYLPMKCKFFLGNTSGIFLISTIQGIPSACANYMPYPVSPFLRKDLFYPKILRKKNTGEILSFSEIYKLGLFDIHNGFVYENKDIEVVENSSDEILSLCKEMYNLLKNNQIGTHELTPLQYLHKDKFMKLHENYKSHTELSGVIAKCFTEKYPQVMR